jgi:hypothetical protein
MIQSAALSVGLAKSRKKLVGGILGRILQLDLLEGSLPLHALVASPAVQLLQRRHAGKGPF